MEALEDKVTLSILKLSDFLLLLEFVVFHGGRHIVRIGRILGVEHMSTKIQNSLFVVRLMVSLSDLLLRESLHEL